MTEGKNGKAIRVRRRTQDPGMFVRYAWRLERENPDEYPLKSALFIALQVAMDEGERGGFITREWDVATGRVIHMRAPEHKSDDKRGLLSYYEEEKWEI